MKVVQLGCGITGLVCAEHLAANPRIDELMLADSRTEGAESLIEKLGSSKLSAVKVDGGDRDAVGRLLGDADVVVNSLPWEFSDNILETAARTGTNYVDFCMSMKTLKDFDSTYRMCKEAGITAITAVGLEPGISDVLARCAANKLDAPEEAHVIDGDNGVIDGYEWVSTWSPVDWIEEVTIPAAVYRDGKIAYVPPLHEREVYDFPPPIGTLPVYKTIHDETFLIPRFIKGIKNADFRISIDDNFAAMAKTVRRLGLHTKEPIDVRGVKVRPLDVLAALMPPPVEVAGKIKGHGGTVVEVIGQKDSRRTKVRMWTMVSHEEAYRRCKTNATGYLVGTGGAVPTELLVEGFVKQVGLVAPEQLPSEEYVSRLRDKGLEVNEQITSA